MTRTKSMTGKIAWGGLLVGLSVLGGYLSIPMPGIGSTIAFDSLPGFFGALFLSPGFGAWIGAAGHLVSALIHGFPQGLPSHALIMLFMGFSCASLGLLYKKNKVLAFLTAFLLNSPITLFLASWLAYAMGMTPTLLFVFYLLLLPLSLAAAANILMASILFEAIGKRYK